MNQFDKKLHQMAAEEKIETPDPVKSKLEATLLTLPQTEPIHMHFSARSRSAIAAACLAFLLIFILPNVSVAYAQSMEKIPIIGDLIHVVTIRNYFYSDQRHELDIAVPQVSDETISSASDIINEDVDALTRQLVQQFYDDLEFSGNAGHGSIYVDYNVQTNTPRWFTLKLSVQVTAGSSSRYFEYYHIDRKTGKVVQLSDMFRSKDFNHVITEDIKQQMLQRMEDDPSQTYFIKNVDFGFEFANVDDDHNFYFNSDGDLVIPFDKYEVGPGSMGCPEFVIDDDVIDDLLKDEFKDIIS